MSTEEKRKHAIARLRSWLIAGVVPSSVVVPQWDPFENHDDWAMLLRELEARGAVWQERWLFRLEDVIREWYCFANSDIVSGQDWRLYKLATASTQAKAEAMYRVVGNPSLPR